MGKRTGKLIVLSSPSGGGKSTIIEALHKRDPELGYSVSATTRKPRQGERDGIDYYFWNTRDFFEKVNTNAFLEWKQVHGHYYGTLRSEIDRQLKEGHHVLLDIDVKGGLHIKEIRKDAVLIFILPPSMDILKERLIKRGTEKESDQKTRLNNAKQEIDIADQYDFQIINNELNKTVEDVLSVIHHQ